MTKRSITSLAAMATLLAATAAVAADTPSPKPAPGEPREVHRVVVTTDGDEAGDFAWFDEGDDMMFDLDGEDGGAPGQPGERKVIVRRIGGGPGKGMGMGHGAGMAQCDDANCDGSCGMHGGPGMGMGPGGHGRGMAMGMGHDMGMRRGKGGPGGHAAMMFGMLDLSDAQKAKMREIHEKQERAQIQSRADLQIARLDMRKLVHAENPDAAAINAQVDRMAKIRSDMAKARIATMLEARAQLTPDQRKKFDAMRANGPGMGHGGMGGPGRMMMFHGQPGQSGNAPAPTKPKTK